MTSGLARDAGALIAFERKDRRVVALLAGALHGVHARRAHRRGRPGMAQRQEAGRLARLLAADEREIEALEIEALDDRRAREAGSALRRHRDRDIIDAAIVLGAKARGHPIVTSTRRISSVWTWASN